MVGSASPRKRGRNVISRANERNLRWHAVRPQAARPFVHAEASSATDNRAMPRPRFDVDARSFGVHAFSSSSLTALGGARLPRPRRSDSQPAAERRRGGFHAPRLYRDLNQTGALAASATRRPSKCRLPTGTSRRHAPRGSLRHSEALPRAFAHRTSFNPSPTATTSATPRRSASPAFHGVPLSTPEARAPSPRASQSGRVLRTRCVGGRHAAQGTVHAPIASSSPINTSAAMLTRSPRLG